MIYLLLKLYHKKTEIASSVKEKAWKLKYKFSSFYGLNPGVATAWGLSFWYKIIPKIPQFCEVFCFSAENQGDCYRLEKRKLRAKSQTISKGIVWFLEAVFRHCLYMDWAIVCEALDFGLSFAIWKSVSKIKFNCLADAWISILYFNF